MVIRRRYVECMQILDKPKGQCTIQRNWQHWVHKTYNEDKQNKKHNTICGGYHHTPDTRRRQTKQKHNTICGGYHHTPDTRRRQTKQKHNTICVGHHHTPDTRRRQTKQKHNIICGGYHHT